MKHVLLIDDQIDIQEMLADLLRNHGIAVDAYANGEQAIKRLKEKTYDLIITDLNMPKLGGFEFIEDARKTVLRGLDIPFLIITGGKDMSEDHLYQLGKEINAQVLRKPFSKQAFLDSVCAAFGINPADIHTLMGS